MHGQKARQASDHCLQVLETTGGRVNTASEQSSAAVSTNAAAPLGAQALLEHLAIILDESWLLVQATVPGSPLRARSLALATHLEGLRSIVRREVR